VWKKQAGNFWSGEPARSRNVQDRILWVGV